MRCMAKRRKTWQAEPGALGWVVEWLRMRIGLPDYMQMKNSGKSHLEFSGNRAACY